MASPLLPLIGGALIFAVFSTPAPTPLAKEPLLASPQEPASPPVEADCTSLCKNAQSGTQTLTNPAGGIMTITFENMSDGTCGCETPPCVEQTKCKGTIKFSFNDDVSWQTWVPHVTDESGGVVPVCAHPGPGSNKPPDSDHPMAPGCGNHLEFTVMYWKKRLAQDDHVDFTDLLVSLKCSKCTVQNCL